MSVTENVPDLHLLAQTGRQLNRIFRESNALLVVQTLMERIDLEHSVKIICKEEFDAYCALVEEESFCPPNCVIISIIPVKRTGSSYRIGFCEKRLRTILTLCFALDPYLYSEEKKKVLRELLREVPIENDSAFIYNMKNGMINPILFTG